MPQSYLLIFALTMSMQKCFVMRQNGNLLISQPRNCQFEFKIDQPALNLFARDFYMLLETEDERLAYRTLVRDVLVLLNADPKVAERDSLEILQFETELANVKTSLILDEMVTCVVGLLFLRAHTLTTQSITTLLAPLKKK